MLTVFVMVLSSMNPVGPRYAKHGSMLTRRLP